MDPITHALLGASAAHLAAARRLGRRAWAVGAGGALLPDLDVLIRSAGDPLLAIEYHRGFTHALAFVPLGGLLAAAPWLLSGRMRREWRAVYAAATLGYATHGPLDAATTYGTQLLWPFSSMRVAWDVVAIVDPLFTLVLLLGLAAAVWRRSALPAAAALLLCAAYLGLGAAQRERAMEAQRRIAAERGHAVTRGAVFPGIGSNVVWRSLYLAGDSMRSDRIHLPWRGAGGWSAGGGAALLREEELPAAVRGDARMLRDFRRMRWFSDGWVARAPGDTALIGDGRYSLRTESFDPVWGIRFRPGASPPTEWVNRTREREIGLPQLWRELRGGGVERPLPRRE